MNMQWKMLAPYKLKVGPVIWSYGGEVADRPLLYRQ